METTKKCFKCGKELPLSMYYAHSKMKDKHLNKCKDCTRSDVHKKYMDNTAHDWFVEKERARGRDKYIRLGYKCKSVHTEGSNTSRKLKNEGIITEGFVCHHWNYNEPYNVLILSRRAHRYIHNFIEFDSKTKMFINKKDGCLLDSIDKHHRFILDVINNVTLPYDTSVSIYTRK